MTTEASSKLENLRCDSREQVSSRTAFADCNPGLKENASFFSKGPNDNIVGPDNKLDFKPNDLQNLYGQDTQVPNNQDSHNPDRRHPEHHSEHNSEYNDAHPHNLDRVGESMSPEAQKQLAKQLENLIEELTRILNQLKLSWDQGTTPSLPSDSQGTQPAAPSGNQNGTKPTVPADNQNGTKPTVPTDNQNGSKPAVPSDNGAKPSIPSDKPTAPSDKPTAPTDGADWQPTQPAKPGQIVGAEKMPSGETIQHLTKLEDHPKNLTVESLKKLKDSGIGGYQQIYQLPMDRPLTKSELDFISRDYAAAREAGMPIISRFNYSNASGGADASSEMIMTHLKQLQPVLHANEDVIGAVELGFVGPWGEFHSGSHNNGKNYALAKDIYEGFSEALPNTPIAFRTANLVRHIFGENPPANVILHNDSIGQRLGAPMEHNDGGSYPNPGDYDYIVRHKLLTIGENNRDSNPQEILKRIQDINITSMHFWGEPERQIKQSGMYDKIIAAMKANAARNGIPA